MKRDQIPAWACGRCDTYEGVDAQELILFGGLHARLCLKCRNAWGERLEGMKQWTQIGQIDTETAALLAMSKQPGEDRRRDLEVLRFQKEDLKKQFREEGKKFMEELKVEASKP